jgi:hypothetical protein
MDPEFEILEAYSLDYAIRFAMLIAPALTTSLSNDTHLTQLCIPVLMGKGLDSLGTNVVQEGELMLRAFIRVVSRVAIAMQHPDLRDLVPFARTHKAESVESEGERWYSKACRSDREAVGLLRPDVKGPKRTQVYCYLGGGGLTDASTSHVDLAQGVVCRTKTWAAAVAVCVATTLLTSAVPGPTVLLEPSFCTADCDDDLTVISGGVHDNDEYPEAEPFQETQNDVVGNFIAMYGLHLSKISKSIGLPTTPLEKTPEDAKTALMKLRQFMSPG